MKCTTVGWVFCWLWDVGGRTGPLSTESMRVYAVLVGSFTNETFGLKGQRIPSCLRQISVVSRLFGIRDWHPSFGIRVGQRFFGIRDWHPSLASEIGTQVWHPTTQVPNSNVGRIWHPLLAIWHSVELRLLAYLRVDRWKYLTPELFVSL